MGWLQDYEALSCLLSNALIEVASPEMYIFSLKSKRAAGKHITCNVAPEHGFFPFSCGPPSHFSYRFLGTIAIDSKKEQLHELLRPKWPSRLSPFQIGAAISAISSIATCMTGLAPATVHQEIAAKSLPSATPLTHMFLVATGFAVGLEGSLSSTIVIGNRSITSTVWLSCGRLATVNLKLQANKVVAHASATWAKAQPEKVSYIHQALHQTTSSDGRCIWDDNGCTELGATLEHATMSMCILVTIAIMELCESA